LLLTRPFCGLVMSLETALNFWRSMSFSLDRKLMFSLAALSFSNENLILGSDESSFGVQISLSCKFSDSRSSSLELAKVSY
jgi:hypothetical protein